MKKNLFINNGIITKPVIPGRLICSLVGMWIASSCSRYFGLPDIEGLPQLTLERLFFITIIIFAVIHITIHRTPLRPFRWSEIALWVITIIALISGVIYGGFFSGYRGAGITILLNWILLPAIVFSIVLRTNFKYSDIIRFAFIVTIFGAYLGITAILERTSLSWLIIPHNIVDPSISQHFGRSRGPFLQAEFNGVVMVQIIPIAMLYASSGGWIRSVFGNITLIILVIGCYLTSTRAAMLSLIIISIAGIMYQWKHRNKYRILLICIFLGGITMFFIDREIVVRIKEINPIQDRIKLMSASIDIITKHPIFGIGFGNFDLFQEKYFDPQSLMVFEFTEGDLWAGGTHNTLLTPFSELGIVIGIINIILIMRYIFVFNSIGNKSYILVDMTKHNNIIISGILVSIAYVINAFFVELRFTLTPNALFWIYAAFTERYRGL